MAVRTIILSAYGAVLLCAIIAPAIPKSVPSSEISIADLDLPQKRSDALGSARDAIASPRDELGDDDKDEQGEEQPETAVDDGEDGMPPLPYRAVPPSLRAPKVYSEPMGPPSPQKAANRNRDEGAEQKSGRNGEQQDVAADEGEDGIPPMPDRALPPSLRDPRFYSEPMGPPLALRTVGRNGGEDNDDDDDDREARKIASDEGEDGMPPLPERAIAPSLRDPKIFDEPMGPPPPSRNARDDDDDDQDMSGKGQQQAAAEEGLGGMPPLPDRAVPPSLRDPKVFSQPVGPQSPPQTWSQDEIADAQAACKMLLPEADFDFQAVSPIREGACGAPAPIQLKGLKHDIKVALHPAATMTCPLANALGRWMNEVVQPRAKALLEADITEIADLSAYACRPRYGNSTQRISYHAFAEAVDVAAFITAKGERVSVLDHWSANDKRAQFLREIHDGACKIFGTVLGPEANAAHGNHFHLDMAKRRHSAFCE